MSNRNIISFIISGILYVLVQVLLLGEDLMLFNKAFCFVYLTFLLLAPLEWGSLILMGVGFGVGLVLDMFYDTPGMHAASSVFMMYIRSLWVNMITPQGGYDTIVLPSIRNMGLQWFSMYAAPLIFLHHFVLLMIEAGGFSSFGFTFVKILSSSLFTFVVIVMVQYLFYRKKKSL